MKSRVLAIAMVVGLLLAALPAAAAFATDDDNGQKIGQDKYRLALTVCSNAGGGNGPEMQKIAEEFRYIFPVKTIFKGECLRKKLNTKDDFEKIVQIVGAVLQHTSVDTCDVDIYGKFLSRQWYLVTSCEIDPGNSAGNNNADD